MPTPAAPAKKAAATKRPAGWPAKLPSGTPFPCSMGELPDTLKAAINTRLAAQKRMEEELKKLKADELALKDFIINEVPKSKAGGIIGTLYKAEITQREEPKVDVENNGWHKVYETIVNDYLTHKKRKDGQEDAAFALLQKRLGDAAVKEMWETGKTVPGVNKFTVVDVSVTKR
jgi:hypothetical protein